MNGLDGSSLVLPYHPDGFVGALEADGQSVQVAALACDGEHIIMLSLVGYDTSVGVMLGRLWGNTKVQFNPAFAWQDDWRGPAQVQRANGSYRTTGGQLANARQVHVLALLRSASIREGILNPPELPEPPPAKTDTDESHAASAEESTSLDAQRQKPKPPPWVTRYILGNWNECGPNRRAFQGVLSALRIPILYRHDSRPELPNAWADALWQRGLSAGLIAPIEALGIRAWRVSGDLLAWAALTGSGVREGWLPWR